MKINWITGAAVLVSTGGLVACGAATQTGAAPGPSAVTSTAPTLDATTGVGSAPTRTPAPPAVKGSNPKGSISTGGRQFAIVRTQASESVVSLLDNGKLAEVDDDSGKTLFVLSPVGGGKYLIRTAELDPATNGSQACWQVRNPHNASPLTVQKASCNPASARQQFTITAQKKNGRPAYAISNSSAFLQHSPTAGLILEELGDAPLTTTFTFIDNGPAPAVD